MSISIPSQKSQESVFRLARPIELDEHNHATSSFGVLEPDEHCGFVNTVVKDQAGTDKGLGIVQRPACGAAYTSGSGSGSGSAAAAWTSSGSAPGYVSATSATRRYDVNAPRAHNSAYKAKSKSNSRLELQSPNPGSAHSYAHEGPLNASCYKLRSEPIAAAATTPGPCAPEDIENQPHFVVTRAGPGPVPQSGIAVNAPASSTGTSTDTGTDATLNKPLTELNLNLNLHLNLPYPYPHPHQYAHSHPPGAALCNERERSDYSPELHQQQQDSGPGSGAGAHTPVGYSGGSMVGGSSSGVGGGLFSRHASPAIGTTACCYPLTSYSSSSIQVHQGAQCAPVPVHTEGGSLNLKHIEPCVFCEYENANTDLGLKAASETKMSMKLEDKSEVGLNDPLGTKDSQSAVTTPTTTGPGPVPEHECVDNDNEEDKQLSAATIAYSRTLFLRPTYAPLLRNSENAWPSTQEAIAIRPSALIRRDFV